ncbi:MAG: hypothetical protein K0R27_2086 [Xanthobacteraceae bacterium]|jgi:hypothetical protein|nr:hypothetical protein [Xanthobacteraceae bacterium]
MGEFNGHRGDEGTFTDDKARGDKTKVKPTETREKSPKDVPAGNPTRSGEHRQSTPRR